VSETSPPRARLTPKGRATRDRIVESAAEVVFKSGARATSLDEVRQDMGASKSQLYHYFSDKDELLRAVIDFQGLRVLEAQQPELVAVNSFATLRRWRDKLIELADVSGRIGGCPLGSLANELAPLDAGHRAALAVRFAAWAVEIERAFIAMQACGALDADLDAEALSALFLSVIQGGLLFAKLNRSSKPLADALDAVIALLETRSPSPGSSRK
jgi:TetR/AcrR family transcriptional regulator, transcriptional repressor for nem operon